MARATLRWEAASEQCLRGADLKRAANERLGREVLASGETDLVVDGRIGGASGAWTAELSLSTAAGTPLGHRSLTSEAEHCSALDEGLVLVVAMMVDVPVEKAARADELAEQRREAERRAAAGDPQPNPPPPPLPIETTPIAIPKRAPAPREPWELTVGVLANAGVGVAPGAAVGVGGAVSVKPPAFWRVELSGTWWAAAEYEESAGRGVRVARRELALDVCPALWSTDTVALEPCLGQAIGVLDVEAFGYSENRAQRRSIAALRARARLRWMLASWLGARVDVLGAVPLVRDRFVVRRGDDTAELYRAAPVGGVFGLGFEGVFP